MTTTHHTTTVLWPFFRDYPGEPMPEQNTLTIRLGTTPSGLTSTHLYHPPFFTGRMPSCRPTNSVKALKAQPGVTMTSDLLFICDVVVVVPSGRGPAYSRPIR